MSEYLLESGLVTCRHLLRGVVKNFHVSRPGARASRREYFFGRLNHAGEYVLQKRVRQSKLAVGKSEE